MFRRGLSLTLLALAAAAGCADSPAAPAGQTAIRSGDDGLRIEPARHVLTAIGERVQLFVMSMDGEPGDLPGPLMSWYSLDPDVATVDAMGVVEAVSNGVARIVAMLPGTRSGPGGLEIGSELEAEITVLQAAHELTARQANVIAYVGQTLLLAMEARDARGVTLPPNALQWESSDVGIATVDEVGMLTGKRAGEVLVRASRDGREAWVHVRVEHAFVEIGSDGAARRR